jgi:hypothetical protein
MIDQLPKQYQKLFVFSTPEHGDKRQDVRGCDHHIELTTSQYSLTLGPVYQVFQE